MRENVANARFFLWDVAVKQVVITALVTFVLVRQSRSIETEIIQ